MSGASVVVTGLGVAAPNGLGAAEFRSATRAGRCAIGPVRRFDPADYPSRLAGEVDLVFADAAAIRELDRVEADAIGAVFGAFGVPVAVPKTMTGRLYSGAAALDLVAALQAMADGVIPPSVNVEPDQDYQLDLVTGPRRRARLRTVLVLARGQGGFNSAMVLRAV